MTNYDHVQYQKTRRIRRAVYVTPLVLAFTVAVASSAHAEHVIPPQVPADIQVTRDNRAFLEGHAAGTQDYICLPSVSGFAWTFFGPQATLFNHEMKQIITHFLSPNPFEGGMGRATWQDSQDTSVVWAKTTGTTTDGNFVRPGAIPWLRLQVVGAQDGPTNGDKLTDTSFIQRVNTAGGSAPADGCAGSADVGKTALVPYKADYVFYRYADRDHDN